MFSKTQWSIIIGLSTLVLGSIFYLSVNKSKNPKSKLKNKLQKFDESLSEWENMKANGFDRIWDCGHTKWIYKPKTV